jgi:hypothetical protein
MVIRFAIRKDIADRKEEIYRKPPSKSNSRWQRFVNDDLLDSVEKTRWEKAEEQTESNQKTSG